jgi:hypothetical protein
MPSLVSFDKNIIAWVDDIPKNNEKTINSLLAQKLSFISPLRKRIVSTPIIAFCADSKMGKE